MDATAGCDDGRGAVPPASAPQRVRFPVNVHHWDRITFLHWRLDPSVLQRLLPDGMRPATFDGWAWVGVTPFFIRVRPLAVPFVPPRCAFPETNVRTYVVGPDGQQAIWFLRLEVTAAWFVAALRTAGLPYVRQRMSVDATPERIVYRSRPRRRSGDGGHDITVQPGPALDPPTGGPFEQFLTARWRALHKVGPALLATPVEHEPWRLQSANVPRCDVAGLFRAVGLPEPREAPLAHHSPGVTVRIGVPSLVHG